MPWTRTLTGLGLVIAAGSGCYQLPPEIPISPAPATAEQDAQLTAALPGKWQDADDAHTASYFRLSAAGTWELHLDGVSDGDLIGRWSRDGRNLDIWYRYGGELRLTDGTGRLGRDHHDRYRVDGWGPDELTVFVYGRAQPDHRVRKWVRMK